MIEFDDNVIEIIRKQDRTISAANQSFFDSLPATEQRIFNAVSKHVQKFSSDGENFVFDDGNTLLTNQVERIILDALQSSKYPSDVNGFLRNFENIKQFNFDVHGNVNDLTPEQLGELINPIQRATVEQTLQGLTGSGVSSNFIEPLRTGIFQNVVAGSTKSDLEAYLRRFILGNPEVDGLLSRYVKQVSRDALNQFDGQVNAKIANEFGLDAYRYVGSLIEDSRPQCRRWVAMQVIQKKDLPSEIAWMNANGTGAIPGTSPETFSIYRGGYNCRHSAIPFKLTKSQREQLNLEPIEPTPPKIEQQIKEVQKEITNTKNPNTFDFYKENLFRSTQSDSNNEKFNDVLLNTNEVLDVISKEKTKISLRSSKECTPAGTKEFLIKTPTRAQKLFMKINPLNTPSISEIGLLPSSANGNCARENEFMNVRFDKGQKIEFKKYKVENSIEYLEGLANKNKDLSIVKNGEQTILVQTKKGKQYVMARHVDGKTSFWSCSSISRSEDNNIAPTITHELGHVIQNSKDPSKTIQGQIFNRLKLKLSDAPTSYGKTNTSEFWTESLTSYVYYNDWLKSTYPNVFDYVETYVKAMGIDLKTIKIAK